MFIKCWNKLLSGLVSFLLGTRRPLASSHRGNRGFVGGYKFERLESRQMFAGDVAVAMLSSGDIYVVGDSAANEVVIRKGLDSREVIVEGRNGTRIVDGRGGTRINASLIEFNRPHIETVLDVSLKGGRDHLNVRGAFRTSHIGFREMRLRGQGGADTIIVEHATLRQQANGSGAYIGVSGGAREDRIVLNDVSFRHVISRRPVTSSRVHVSGQKGPDTIRLINVTEAKSALLEGGKGRDDISVENSAIDGIMAKLGAGSGTFSLHNSRGHSVTVRGRNVALDWLDDDNEYDHFQNQTR